MDLIQVLQKPKERILLTPKEPGLGSGRQTQQPKANHSLELAAVILGQLQKRCRLHTETTLTIKSKGVWQNTAAHCTSGWAKKTLHSKSETLMRLGKRSIENTSVNFY